MSNLGGAHSGPPSLNNPAAALFRRFQWERQPGDLEKSLVLVSDGPSYDHPERLALLDNFANELTRTVGPMPRLGDKSMSTFRDVTTSSSWAKVSAVVNQSFHARAIPTATNFLSQLPVLHLSRL
jgi:hypothetical protein